MDKIQPGGLGFRLATSPSLQQLWLRPLLKCTISKVYNKTCTPNNMRCYAAVADSVVVIFVVAVVVAFIAAGLLAFRFQGMLKQKHFTKVLDIKLLAL